MSDLFIKFVYKKAIDAQVVSNALEVCLDHPDSSEYLEEAIFNFRMATRDLLDEVAALNHEQTTEKEAGNEGE